MSIKSLMTAVLTLCGAGLQAQNTEVALQLTGLEADCPVSIRLAGTFVEEDPIQTIHLQDGAGQFAFDSDGIRVYTVGVDNAYGSITLVLDKGEKASVKADAVASTAYDNVHTMYQFQHLDVSGSDTHAYYLTHKADREVLNSDYARYHEENKEVVEQLGKLERGSAEWKALTASPAYQKLEADEHAFFAKADSVMKAPVLANKDNEWGPLFLCTAMNYIPETEKKTYDQFSDAAKRSFYGKIVGSFVSPKSVEGEQKPDFTFTDHATGTAYQLHDICARHKYVLLDFWASWCGPCRKEIPNFKRQYNLYKDKGLAVLSISADTSEAAWLKALDEEQLPWYNDIDGQKGICKLYKVAFYPTVYLLDSACRVVAMNSDCRGEKLAELLKQLMP